MRPCFRSRLAPLVLTLAGAVLSGPVAQAYPLKIAKTEMRTVLRDRVGGVADEVVYRSNGPVLDESHLRRNLNDKPDGKVHLALADLGDGAYELTLQSLDTGRADRFHAAVSLVLPGRVSCDGGYWEVIDGEVQRNDLADTPDLRYWLTDQGILVSLHKRSEGHFRFLGGAFVLRFRVNEHCF